MLIWIFSIDSVVAARQFMATPMVIIYEYNEGNCLSISNQWISLINQFIWMNIFYSSFTFFFAPDETYFWRCNVSPKMTKNNAIIKNSSIFRVSVLWRQPQSHHSLWFDAFDSDDFFLNSSIRLLWLYCCEVRVLYVISGFSPLFVRNSVSMISIFSLKTFMKCWWD